VVRKRRSRARSRTATANPTGVSRAISSDHRRSTLNPAAAAATSTPWRLGNDTWSGSLNIDHIVLAMEHTSASAFGVEKKKTPLGVRCERTHDKNEEMS
jgi:hypothetical protein